MGWLLSALGFAVVGLGSLFTLSRGAAAVLATIAVAALLPPPVTGLAAAGRGHDWATDAAVLQAVAAAALWLGVLAGARRPPAASRPA